jgi:hypothetical protein
MKVITYQLAYIAGERTLCPTCAESRLPWSLGPVSHGLREGSCEWCQHPEDEGAPDEDEAPYRRMAQRPEECRCCGGGTKWRAIPRYLRATFDAAGWKGGTPMHPTCYEGP